MTRDKAIEILELMGIDIKYWKDDEGEKALKLGIEALKRLQENRTLHFIPSLKLLPGETEVD